MQEWAKWYGRPSLYSQHSTPLLTAGYPLPVGCLPGVPSWASVPHVLHLPFVLQAVTKIHRWHKTHNLKPTDQDSCATMAQKGTAVHAAPRYTRQA